MHPDLEVVQIRPGESFKAWAHGYPFHTVRWHFHPEYELHHVVATTGRYFVGDFIGEFEPGNLVLTGPNLPHNWVSDLPAGTCVPLRGRVVQFSEEFIADATAALARTRSCCRHARAQPPRRAVLRCARQSLPVRCWRELVEAQGRAPHRAVHGPCRHLEPRRRCPAADQRQLSARPVRLHVGRHQRGARLHQRSISPSPSAKADLAAIAGRSPSAFSRSFRRHTGMSLVQYVNRLRINLACQLLMSEEQAAITEICFAAGYNNLSNFNRQFLAQKGMTPSRFRALLAENRSAEIAA